MRNQDFPYFIRTVKRIYDEYCKEVGMRLNLSRLEIDIMAFLQNNPKHNTARDVSELRMLPKSNVSAGVESLIRKGYVERNQSEEDKRISKLSLTEKSKVVRKEIMNMQKSFYEYLFDGISIDERKKLDETMSKIKANVITRRTKA